MVLALTDIPKELRDSELCSAAVTQDDYALRDIPKELGASFKINIVEL